MTKITFAATMATRVETKGTFMVDAVVKTLSGLEKDVDLIEFLQQVQNNCVKTDVLVEHQTPQVTIFPTKRLIFHKEYGVTK
jgi:hypothetical protein